MRALCALASLFAFLPWLTIASPPFAIEETIWNLELSYWQYVQQGNLTAYQTLWHNNFLGWPSVSDVPVRKDHITDWITSQTSKGLSFQLTEFKPAAIQVNGDLVVVYYWVTSKWVNKDGRGTDHTLRITHTWVKNGKDWQIVGGMSMLEPAKSDK
jgi:hypothetical protein